MTFNSLDYDMEMFSFSDEIFHGSSHGFFTRKGGVSGGAFASLNLGGSIGDKPENVIENRRRIFHVIGRDPQTLFDVWQVHSDEIIFTDRAREINAPHFKADGIFTDKPNITILMRFADCVPIILYDPVKGVVGMVHAGWAGTVNQIAARAIREVSVRYGCKPHDIIAGIGPSIGPDHYIIGEDVYRKALPVFSDFKEEVLPQENGVLRFDLWRANENLLLREGVGQIMRADICTACDTERWFSHRAENGKTGRFAAVIALSG